VIYFAADNTPPGAAVSSAFGINLFFNGDLTHDRISAAVPDDRTNSFNVIYGTTNTFGETVWNAAPIAGSGSISYSTGDYAVTLSDLYVLAPGSSSNLVEQFGYPAVGSIYDHSPDTIGSITLTVTSVPEPSAYAAFLGAVVLGFAAHRRRLK